MEDWQQRVSDERDELSLKISKLEDFLASKPEHVAPEDIQVLYTQKCAMLAYRGILDVRLRKFMNEAG